MFSENTFLYPMTCQSVDYAETDLPYFSCGPSHKFSTEGWRRDGEEPLSFPCASGALAMSNFLCLCMKQLVIEPDLHCATGHFVYKVLWDYKGAV